MEEIKSTFWKTYVIDVLLLVLLFILGAVAKNRVAAFFSNVEGYDQKALALEPGLVNQSAVDIIQMDALVNDFSQVVFMTYILMVFIVPILIYLFFTITQSLNATIVKGKTNPKFIGKSVLIGLPFLAIFLIFETQFLASFAFFLDSVTNLILFISFIILIGVMACIWYTLSIGLLLHKKMLYKQTITKALRWGPWFFAYALSFFVIFLLLFFALIRYLTESFIGYGWVGMVVVALLALVLVQYFRFKLIKSVKKYH